MTVYALADLVSPTREWARRKRLAPVSWFVDDGIGTIDYPTWARTESRLRTWEGDFMRQLCADITDHGLRTPVEIQTFGITGACMHDGHHRVVALRHLGAVVIPYRWLDHHEARFVRRRLPLSMFDHLTGV